MSREAIKAQARMFELLQEHVEADGTKACYADGWSDARVAEACGLSVSAVAEAREVLRPGTLADPAIDALLRSIAGERERSEREIADVRIILANVERDADRRIADLEQQLHQHLARRGR